MLGGHTYVTLRSYLKDEGNILCKEILVSTEFLRVLFLRVLFLRLFFSESVVCDQALFSRELLFKRAC